MKAKCLSYLFVPKSANWLVACPSCHGESFTVPVGFEVPSDSQGPDNTSWFAVAVECARCQWHGIIFDNETA